VAQSRTGAHFSTVDHIKEQLAGVPDEIVLDGELYTNHIPFETLAGLLKKKKLSEEDKEKLKQIQYHCYDVYLPHKKEATFEERLQVLSAIGLRDKVQTERIHTIEEFDSKFSEYTSQGYEGIMVRTPAGKYSLNYRSKDLCKYKEFEEAEYVITGFTQGEGRDAGTVIWICETPDGKAFHVRPRGTLQQRAEWFQQGEEAVGKKLTVIYQNLSEQGVPRFPVGKSVREGF
jgi:DNA ligase-1